MTDNQNTAKQTGRNPDDKDTQRKGDEANAGAQDRNRQGQGQGQSQGQNSGQASGQSQGQSAGKPGQTGQATKTTGNPQAGRDEQNDKGAGQTAKGPGREQATGSAEGDESEESDVVVKPMNKTGTPNSGNR